MTTQTSETLSVSASPEQFKKADLTSLMEAQKTIKKVTAAALADVNDKIRYHNLVLSQTFRKFSEPFVNWDFYNKHKLPSITEENINVETFLQNYLNPKTLVYTFTINNKQVNILTELLRCDPIASSQHARLIIRDAQHEALLKEGSLNKNKVLRLKREIGKLTKELERAEKEEKSFKERVVKKEKFLINKRNKMLKNKTKNTK